jgi:protein TonB
MGRNWLLGTAASALLHGGVAAAFLVTLNARPGQLVEHGDVGTISVELVDAPPQKGAAQTTATAQPLAAPSVTDLAKTPTPEAVGPFSAADAPPTGAASSMQAAAAADPGALSSYYRELENHLARFHRYPATGAGARPNGMVRVALIVQRDGRVLDAWIETSSGVVMLDNAAMKTLRAAEPLPVLPATLPGSIDLVVPLRYAAAARAAG